MAKDTSQMKTFNMKLEKDMWMFLKKTAAAQEESMTDIVTRCVAKYQKKLEGKNHNNQDDDV